MARLILQSLAGSALWRHDDPFEDPRGIAARAPSAERDVGARSQERRDLDHEGWQEVLKLAIRLAGNCHDACLKARPKVRLRFNEAVLKAVYIKDGKLNKVEFQRPIRLSFLMGVRIRLYQWR